jgi:hypothetical protein
MDSCELNTVINRAQFYIVGNGSELSKLKLNKSQDNYWRIVFDSDADANERLAAHLRSKSNSDFELIQFEDVGYLGAYYNPEWKLKEFPMLHSSKFIVDLYFNEKLIRSEEYLISRKQFKVQESKIKFLDEVSSDKQSIAFAKTMDRGNYFLGKIKLAAPVSTFDKSKIVFFIDDIDGTEYIVGINYQDRKLRVTSSDGMSFNRGFGAKIFWGAK